MSSINFRYPLWNEEFKEVQDPRLFWDLMKYRIRQESIRYSKIKAKERRSKLAELETKLSNCQETCDQNPSTENMNMYEVLKIACKQSYFLRWSRMLAVFERKVWSGCDYGEWDWGETL